VRPGQRLAERPVRTRRGLTRWPGRGLGQRLAEPLIQAYAPPLFAGRLAPTDIRLPHVTLPALSPLPGRSPDGGRRRPRGYGHLVIRAGRADRGGAALAGGGDAVGYAP
jgi:hypothetical protein